MRAGGADSGEFVALAAGCTRWRNPSVNLPPRVNTAADHRIAVLRNPTVGRWVVEPIHRATPSPRVMCHPTGASQSHAGLSSRGQDAKGIHSSQGRFEWCRGQPNGNFLSQGCQVVRFSGNTLYVCNFGRSDLDVHRRRVAVCSKWISGLPIRRPIAARFPDRLPHWTRFKWERCGVE